MSTFLSFVLDLSNLWLHHLMASQQLRCQSYLRLLDVCVIYPNQATHQAQAVLDHLSHLYPRPVGYPQRGKGVPFSFRLKKKEDQPKLWASHILCPNLLLEFNTDTTFETKTAQMTSLLGRIGGEGVAFSRPLEKEGSTVLESIPMCVQKFFELFYRALE